jgi:hypothetical protein
MPVQFPLEVLVRFVVGEDGRMQGKPWLCGKEALKIKGDEAEMRNIPAAFFSGAKEVLIKVGDITATYVLVRDYTESSTRWRNWLYRLSKQNAEESK